MAASGEDESRGAALRGEAAGWLARLRGASTAQDQAAFEDWYQADPRHAAAYDAVLESWETAGLARAEPVGPMRSSLAPAGGHRWRYAIAAVAATVVVVVLAFAAAGSGVMSSNPARPVEFAGGAGRIRTIDLADGSRIALAADGLLRTAYLADERRVILVRGRGRFAVAHDAVRPFVVQTPAGLVIAHGTVFDVAISGQRVIVSLLEGSIEVRPARSERSAVANKPAMLRPGQRTVMVAGQPLTPPTQEENTVSASPTGMLSFENAFLGDVVAAANREAASPIVLSDPALARLRFTGTFHATATAELAPMLAATFDLGLSHERGGAFVLSPARFARRGPGKIIPG
jgi:transmembrane sensor